VPFVETIGDDEASGETAAVYDAEREAQGFVSNSTRVFGVRPGLLHAWLGLRDTLTSTMDRRRYELVTLAAARRLRSSYCSLAHGQVLAEEFLGPELTRAVAVDHRTAGLEPVDVAVMDFAEKIAADATQVTQEDIDRLREAGLADTEIVDVVAAAAARCFFTKLMDGLGARPDAAFAELDPALRDVLVVGRPIAGS
jgi:uncharacterized peroxidase-related enzyme